MRWALAGALVALVALPAVLSSYALTLFILIFFYGMARAFLRKEVAGNNPWGPGATTLEWTLTSPPPFHQFEVLPRIK